MPEILNIAGQRFGRLVAQERVSRGSARPGWQCVCDCGNTKIVDLAHLRSGRIKSCGCLRVEVSATRMTTHGHTVGGKMSPEYVTYVGMKDRCSNPNHKDYKYYGGKGIRVCDEWVNDFQAFFDHIGPRPVPHMSVDRIDTNGDYKPGNVRWATSSDQMKNRRPFTRGYSNYLGKNFAMIGDKRYSVVDAARLIGVHVVSLYHYKRKHAVSFQETVDHYVEKYGLLVDGKA